MAAFGLLKASRCIGAKEFRLKLESILRDPQAPYRVMLRSRPAVAVIPDRQYLFLLEILEDLTQEGLLEGVLKRVRAEGRRKNPWFWGESWQLGERRADEDIRSGRVRKFKSVRGLLKDLRG